MEDKDTVDDKVDDTQTLSPMEAFLRKRERGDYDAVHPDEMRLDFYTAALGGYSKDLLEEARNDPFAEE